MIVRNEVDVTEDVMKLAEKNRQIALKSEEYKNAFEPAIIHLIKAKSAINNIRLPWMDDCICESINVIEKALDILYQAIQRRTP